MIQEAQFRLVALLPWFESPVKLDDGMVHLESLI